MLETPQFNPDEFAHEKGDFSGVHNTDFKDELKEAGQEEKEFELTPEIEEKIMEKVQDIDKKGTGYSTINVSFERDQNPYEKLEPILKNGLLGSNGKSLYDLKEWANDVRRNREGRVFINIVGQNTLAYRREHPSEQPYYPYGNGAYGEIDFREPEIASSHWGETPVLDITLLFDVKGFRKLDPVDNQFKNVDQKSHTYRADLEMSFLDKEGIPNTEHGFLLSFRVAPRNFLGILIKKATDSKRIELVKRAMTNVYSSNPNLLLPIYSYYGDLIWPRQMSYEEVKQFVAERDAKKKEGEEHA